MVAQTKPATLPGLGYITEPVNMVTAPKDKKLYRRVTLDNGLRVILIADPEMADQVAGGSESDVDTSNSQAEESSGGEEDDDDEEEEDGEVKWHKVTIVQAQEPHS